MKSSLNGYLSFNDSIWVLTIPALFFLLNGLTVIFLKSISAPIISYLILPLILFVILVFQIRTYNGGLRRSLRRNSVIYLAPLIFSSFHFFVFGTSFGGDTASYFTNPMHSFFSSGHFSLSEQPFIEYGNQPLANYWLPANSEFVFAGLGRVFGLDYPQILAMMHFTSNYLIGLSVWVITLRFLKPKEALLLCLSFFGLLYGMHTMRTDFTATSLFRGFENKGFIWGFYFWASANLLLPAGENRPSGSFLFCSGAILAMSGFLVSGNTSFLIFPVLLCLISSSFAGRFGSAIYQAAGFMVSLLVCIGVFKALETTNVYSVVTEGLTYMEPDSFDIQGRAFSYPIWLWVGSFALAVAAIIRSKKLAFTLIIFLGLSALLHSKVFYNSFFNLLPEFTVNFWRPITLVNPFVPILFAACVLISQLTQPRHRLLASLSACLICAGAYLFGGLNFPQKSPFGQTGPRPIMDAVAEICPENSIILAGRRLGTHLPTAQPSYDYLAGKIVFLNWQIANLPAESREREQAENARNASLYISSNGTEKTPDGLIKTIKQRSPDAIILPIRKIPENSEEIFEGYAKQIYRNTAVFTKPACNTNFNTLVKQNISKKSEK